MQELRHENIIRYHDSFFEEGVLFIVFEWAAGGDLKKVVREAAKPLDESVIWSYFTQISEGLRHMHNLRMVRFRSPKSSGVVVRALWLAVSHVAYALGACRCTVTSSQQTCSSQARVQ